MTNAAKTGGNKKTSSPSSEGYWKRAQASKFAETHKERRIARHIKRCKTSKTKLSASNGLMAHINFPHIPVPRESTRVSFSGSVPEMRTFDVFNNVMSYPTFVIKEGVITDILRVKK